MGILKAQNTLTIAVWSSILLHSAFFMGFELVFSNKRESFPKFESRTVTLLSIGSVQEETVTSEHELHSDIISPQIVEDFIPDKFLPIINKASLVQSEEIPLPNFMSANAESNNSGAGLDQFLGQKISLGAVVEKEVPEIKEPVPVESIAPVYPFRARKKGLEGIVSIEVVVSDTGHPLSCQIIDSSGYNDLDDAGVKTVLAWLFHPGTVDGEYVQSTLRILIKFQLDDS